MAVALVAPQRTAAQNAVPPTPQPPKLVAAVVPSNGVVGVRLPDAPLADSLEDGLIVLRVTDQGGAEVAGAVVTRLANFTVFHPAQPLTVGASYTLQLAYANPPTGFALKQTWATPLMFSVGAPRDANARLPSAVIETSYTDLGEAVERCCENTCFITAMREGKFAVMTAQIQGEANTAGQYVYAFNWENQRNASSGWSISPQTNVLPATPRGPPFEPCRLLYAHSLVDDTEHLLGRSCVDEAMLMPASVLHFPVDDMLAFDRCREPPGDFIARWCEVNFDQCTQDEIACPGYAWRCSAHTAALRAKRVTVDAGTTAKYPNEQGTCSVVMVRSCSANLVWLACLALLSAARGVRSRRVTSGNCSRPGK